MLENHVSNRIPLLHYWKTIVFSMILLAILLLVPQSINAQDSAVTEDAPQRLCQDWHLRSALPANVYAEPDAQSSVIGRVVPNTTLCAYGLSDENPLWMEINPDIDAAELVIGYILQEELRVGTPGTIANPDIFCDAWQVQGTRDINVRSCASTGCGVVTTKNPNDIICVSDYEFSGGNWSFINQPGTSNSGWLRTSNLSYVFDESTGCADNSYQVLNTTPLYNCADANCVTETSYAPGTRVCVQADSFEGATWVEYTEGNDPVGWIRIDLLEPIQSDADLETVSLTQDVNFSDDPVEITTVEEPLQIVTPEPTSQSSIGNNAQVAQVITATPTTAATTVPGANSQGVVQVCPVGANPVVEGQCMTVTPPPLGQATEQGNGLLLSQNVTFGSLFIDNLELLSPQGTSEFFFVLPDDWIVRSPVTLVLDVDYSENLTSFDSDLDLSNAALSSRLDIRLDGVLASSINLDSDDIGRRLIEVPLPTDLLQDPENRFHSITFELNARDYCEVNAETRVFVNSGSSFMRFVYEETIPVLDLSRYPIPFYNSPLGAEVESVWIVLPERPDDIHLQMAASIAAGLGRLTNNNLRVNAIFDTQVTDDLYRNNNLILIGEPSRNSLISELYQMRGLPSTLGGDGSIIVGGIGVNLEEGVIQLAVNPRNSSKAVLVATGTSELGLQRAGRALGGSPSLIGLAGEVAVITNATDTFRTDTPGEDLPIGSYRFTDFDIQENIVLTGSGLKTFSFNFDVPIGGDVREDAYMEILFNATNSVDLDTSSINVLINDVPISGVSLSQVVDEGSAIDSSTLDSSTDRETVQVDFNVLRVAIPQGVIEPGQSNEMQFLVDMQGDWGCDLPSFIWATISNDSLLFIPQEGLDEDYFPLVAQFPIPFNLVPNLQDVWVSLPDQVSTVELTQLVQMMSYLGDATDLAEGIIPTIQTGALPAGINLADYHFIVLGRPSQNNFLVDINDTLPQPFFPGSDELVQEFDDITYRIGPGVNLGVLQMLISPWSPDRVVFVMTGTSEIGQQFAGNAIFDLAFGRRQLQGNIVFVSGIDANPVDTRFVGNAAQILGEAESITGIFPSATPSPTATALEVTEALPSLTPVGTIEPILTAEENALATGIFTESPEDLTATPRPTLPPLPTSEPSIIERIFGGGTPTEDGTTTQPPWINTALLGLGGLIVIMSIFGGVRALRSRADDDDE